MSSYGQDGQPAHLPPMPTARDVREMSEDEWRASLPSLGPQLGTGLVAPGSLQPGYPQPAGGHGVAPQQAHASPTNSTFGTSRPPRPLGTWKVAPSTSSTAAVWWFIALPFILTPVITVGMFVIFGTETIVLLANDILPDTFTGQMFAVYMLGTALLAVIMVMASAFADRSRLRELGHTEVASPWWNLLTPLIYLILRTVYARRATGGGAAPLIVYILLNLAAPFLIGAAIAMLLPGILLLA